MAVRRWIGVLAVVALATPVPADHSRLPPASQADPEIAAMVRSVRAERIDRTIRKLVSFGTRNTLSPQDDPTRGIGAARDWLRGQFSAVSRDSGGRLQVSEQSFLQGVARRIPHPTRLTNLLALLPGEAPNPGRRIVVVSGHYDSICSSPVDALHDAPGADDDASGTAAVLEIARVMSRYHFRIPILFAAVAGEEQGLLGSGYLAAQLKRDGWRVEAMFTNDIIGSSSGPNGTREEHRVRVFAGGPPEGANGGAAPRGSAGGDWASPERELAGLVRDSARRYVPGMELSVVYRRDRYLRGGDHLPFLEQGFPALRFTEAVEDYRHQHQDVRTEGGVLYGDLADFVDPTYTARVARVNAASLAVLARAPAPPRSVGIVIRRLSPDTELTWSPGAEGEEAEYEVVWRATTEPFWTRSRLVGRETACTLAGVCRDDYYFGVRSVDRGGHRSAAVFALPVR